MQSFGGSRKALAEIEKERRTQMAVFNRDGERGCFVFLDLKV
jgi:hypothetical protein